MIATTLPGGPRPTPAATARETWPDVAKGVCILLVVLWHVVLKQYQQIPWPTSLPFSAAWGELDEQLLPLRMPLFFTVSGLFAAAAVHRPWRVLLHSSIGRFSALYVLWVLIHTALLAGAPGFPTARATTPLQLLEELTISPTNLWYLLALALYVTAAKALRRVPTAVLLPAAFALSAAAAAGLVPNAGNRWQVLQNLVFFLAGLRLKAGWEALAARATARRVVAVGLSAAAGLGAMSALDAESVLGVRPAVSMLCAIFGVTAAALAARTATRPVRALSALGRRTLPVYVLHLPVLALLGQALNGPLARSGTVAGTALAAVEPLLMTALVVAVCLTATAGLRAAGLGRLFDPLRPLGGRAARDPALAPYSSAVSGR